MPHTATTTVIGELSADAPPGPFLCRVNAGRICASGVGEQRRPGRATPGSGFRRRRPRVGAFTIAPALRLGGENPSELAQGFLVTLIGDLSKVAGKL